jgi:predicted RNA binding protein YcfA (HicA-like mRNA interferase family)
MPVALLRPREVIGAFRKLGWEVARQRGSHIILTKTGHVVTLSIPNHPQVARNAARPDCESEVNRGRVLGCNRQVT